MLCKGDGNKMFAGRGGDGMKIMRGWLEMGAKLDGDGWRRKYTVQGWVQFMSRCMQASNLVMNGSLGFGNFACYP